MKETSPREDDDAIEIAGFPVTRYADDCVPRRHSEVMMS